MTAVNRGRWWTSDEVAKTCIRVHQQTSIRFFVKQEILAARIVRTLGLAGNRICCCWLAYWVPVVVTVPFNKFLKLKINDRLFCIITVIQNMRRIALNIVTTTWPGIEPGSKPLDHPPSSAIFYTPICK